ncbi:MAG TPA: hypothetical protein VFK02_24515 [Kofleriaceae bacterium]|nr:hypothetical protein [Kofleriaceae bacterium]
MLDPAAPSSLLFPATAGPPAYGAHARLAALERTERRLLEAVVFEGASCAELARALGAPAAEVRRRVAAALLARDDAPAVAMASPADDGALETMLALHALDALDPDEAALVEALVAAQPALMQAYDEHRARVGELCATAPRVAPPAAALERLQLAIGDDRALN